MFIVFYFSQQYNGGTGAPSSCKNKTVHILMPVFMHNGIQVTSHVNHQIERRIRDIRILDIIP